MKSLKLAVLLAAFSILTGASLVYSATVLLPSGGGTGTSTAPTAGQILIGTTGRIYAPANLTAGTNITIATSSGGITINSTASGSGSGTVSTSTAGQVGFFPASDNTITGTSTIFISAGNVGIGTTNPSYNLSFGTNNTTKLALFENSGGGNMYGFGYAYDGVIGGRIQFLANGNTNEVMSVLNSGNVGIGTTGPGMKLNVLGSNGFPATSGSAATGGFRIQSVPNSGSYSVLDMGTDNSSGSSWLQATNGGTLNSTYSLLLNPNGGNVGIGTTGPGHRLTIGSDTTGGGNASIAVKQAGGSDGFLTQASSNDDYLQLYHSGSASIITSSYQSSGAYTPLAFYTSDLERVRIQSNGNVGIGTTAPTADLHIYKGAPFFKLEASTGTNYVQQDFVNTGGSVRIGAENSTGAGLLAGTSPYAGVFGTTGAYPLQFSTNNLVRMTIKSDGNVGIGTTGPGYKLDVAGTIRTGVASTTTGLIVLNNASNGNTVSLQSGATSPSYVLTLPTAAGATSSFPYFTDGTGTLGTTALKTVNGNSLIGSGDIAVSVASSTIWGMFSGTSPITFNGSTGAIGIPMASSTVNGYLSSTDWSTFNGKQASLGFTPLNVASNLSDLASASTARTNLGLGTMALLANTGSSTITTVGTIGTGTWNGTAIGAAYGGTGTTTLTANNVILGNGTSSVQFVAPGTSGNVLTSNGTTWTSAAAAGGGVPGIFCDGSDGSATISATTTLTADKCYSALTINSGVSLITASYKVFVNGTLTNNGTISNNGNAGGNGTAGTNGGDGGLGTGGTPGTGSAGGSAGAAVASGSLGGSAAGAAGVSGGGGLAGCVNNCGTATAGTAGATATAAGPTLSATTTAGLAGGGGGNGGNGAGNAGGGGAGGIAGATTTVTLAKNTFRHIVGALLSTDQASTTLVVATNNNGGAGGGGGGGGGGGSGSQPCDGSDACGGAGGGGGGSGGSGSNGGTVMIIAKTITNGATGVISANGGNGGTGGNGGNGGNATTGNAGGGGGGGGGRGGTSGSGGAVVLIYNTLTNSGSITVNAGTAGTGGNAGTKGTKSGSGVNGSDGTAGGTGASGTTGLIIQQTI